jgi:integrase
VRNRVSANTFIREAKALFTKKVLENVRLEGIDRLPFDGISTSERVPMRYKSQIGNFETLIAGACRELNTEESLDCFKVFLLASLAGLRRSEIDLLEWSAFDFDRGILSIEATKYFQGKNESSLGDIPLDPELSTLFRGLRARTKGEFVVSSTAGPKLNQAYSRYRCQRTFDRPVAWLRAKGVTSNQPLHVLRKEFGSAMAQKFGIFAASRALRHSSVAVTEAHYVTQKRAASIGLGHLLATP